MKRHWTHDELTEHRDADVDLPILASRFNGRPLAAEATHGRGRRSLGLRRTTYLQPVLELTMKDVVSPVTDIPKAAGSGVTPR
jgi:hypothetical protein